MLTSAERWFAEHMPDVFESASSPQIPTATDDCIPEGQRNSALTQTAGKLRRLGFPPETIAAALHVENRRRCAVPLSEFEVETIARSVARYPTAAQTTAPTLAAFTLDALSRHTFPLRRPLLLRDETVLFREGHLGQLYAERGIGKTWLAQTMALVAATGAHALGFHALEPCRALYIDGEMASEELQDRFAGLATRLHLTPPATLTIVAADWQDQYLPRLDTTIGQTAIEPFIDQADFIVIDNRSCLFDSEGENDAAAWQSAQDWLLALRRRGKAVLLVHHSNRQGGARGHSKPEDPMNLLIKLTRPEDYVQDQGARFLVTFDKCRGAYGTAVAPFEAQLTADGWQTRAVDRVSTTAEKVLRYVRLASAADQRPKSANAAIAGAQVKRIDGLAAWKHLLDRGVITRHPDGGFHVE